jgi:hypothetical protein
MSKVAFDWDGTAEFESVQQVMKELIDAGHEVHIVTTRWDEDHKHRYHWIKDAKQEVVDDLHKAIYDLAKKLEIQFHFTNMQFKRNFLAEHKFDWLIDDNWEEGIELRDTNVKFMNVFNLPTLKHELF